ncbi:MAG: 50S ribosomal protein L15 [Patescibacteria group bacterium]|nr:MAG: 50S ribosomal protein L15 [Patescibacteria group bacterium]
MSLLNKLTSTTTKSAKRLGRGIGSGKGGHTSTRGQKGQKARQGAKIPLWFEGGQLPLIKRLPMLRGKHRLNVVRPTAEVTLSEVEAMKADTITLDTLKLEKVIGSKFAKAKIVASGKLSRKVTVQGVKVTKTAAEAIVAAGGTVA